MSILQSNTTFKNLNDMQPIKRIKSEKRARTVTCDASLESMSKHRKYEDIENSFSQSRKQTSACAISYVPTRREVDSLCIDNYLYQRVSATTNKDGSIGWRCKEYRTGVKCQSTCRIGVDDEIIRHPSPHNHPCVTDAQLVFMKAKANAKKRCRTEDGISVQKIFLQEIGKAIIMSGISMTADDLQHLPKYEANKRCLQIQRKVGKLSKSASASENGDDQVSVNSFGDVDVKEEENFEQNDFNFNENIVKEENFEQNDFNLNENIAKEECLDTVRSDKSNGSSDVLQKPNQPAKGKSKKKLNSIINGLWNTKPLVS